MKKHDESRIGVGQGGGRFLCVQEAGSGPLQVLDLALGGLNLQIEHHLFPSKPRPNLRQARPIIANHCRVHGISYSESTLLGSYGLALRHLHKVGAPLRNPRPGD